MERCKQNKNNIISPAATTNKYNLIPVEQVSKYLCAYSITNFYIYYPIQKIYLDGGWFYFEHHAQPMWSFFLKCFLKNIIYNENVYLHFLSTQIFKDTEEGTAK